ncbi:MAG: hypothetical protein HY320_00980 [Armatimonadetes bacterium]|nr:hypothetical protein [Armatimonadota bacterium]
MSIETRNEWCREVVVLRPPTGRLRFLVHVNKERCPYCSSGVRTTSIWGTVTGFTEEVAWCGHCFNATCYAVRLPPTQRERFEAMRSAFLSETPATVWDAARPALEDLERRGLL